MQRLCFFAAVIVAGVIGLAAGPAQADTYTWSPTTTGAIPWSADANWNAVPVGGSGTRLTFVDPNATVIPTPTATTYYTPNNDIGGDFQLSTLDLQGNLTNNTASVTIAGNPLRLTTNGGAAPLINLNATKSGNATLNYTVNNTLKLDGTLTLQGNGAGNFTFNGAVTDDTGANGLTKNGSAGVVLAGNNSYAGETIVNGGTVTLSGTNTTTGATTLNAGLLNINNARALGTGPFTIAGTGGSRIDNPTGGNITLTNNNIQNWNADFTFSAAQSVRILDMGTGTVTLSANRKVTVNGTSGGLSVGGVISGDGMSLEKRGTGILTLYGVNRYSGGTLVNGGTLAMGNVNALGSVGTISFGGGTLRLPDTTDLSGRFSQAPNQAYSVDTPSNVTFATPLTSIGGSLSKAGAGRLTLSAANSYTGPTTLNAGTLTFSGAGTLGSTTAPLTLAGGTLDLAGQTVSVGSVNITGSTMVSNGTLTASSYTVGGVTPYIYGILAGPGAGVIKSGANQLVLYGANTYTGDTTISNSTLQLNFTWSTSPLTNIVSSASALKLCASAVNLNGKTTANSLCSQSFNGLTVIAPGASSFSIANGIANGSTLCSLGAISHQAGSTLSLAQPTVNLTVGPTNGYVTSTSNDVSGILGAYATVTSPGATNWAANNGVNIVACTNYTMLSGAMPSLADNAASNVRVTTNSTGDIGQASPVTTVNTLLVSDTNTTGRAITIGANNALRLGASGGILTLSGAGPLTLGAAGSACTLTAGGADNTAGELIVNNNTTITNNAVIADNGSGAVTLVKAGAGSLTLTTTNTYTGGTFVNAGSLFLSPGTDRLATNSAMTVSGTLNLGISTQNVSAAVVFVSGLTTNGRIVKAGANYSGQAGTVAAVLSGNVGLDKTTSGTLYLTAANTYTGDTTVLEGSLVAGSGSSGTVSIPGNLVIGSPTGGPAASVSTSGGTPFSQTKNYTVYPNGSLAFGSSAQWLYGSLTIVGGSVSGSQPYFQTGSKVYMTGGTLGCNTYISDFPLTTYATSTTASVTANLTGGHVFTVADGDAPIDLLFSGSMTTAGKVLTKAGPGVMSITGVGNTYNGGTAVSAGTLLANNSVNSGSGFGSATGSGGVTNAAGTTLGGIGFIGGVAGYSNANVVLQNGTAATTNTTLAPGTIDPVTGAHTLGTLTIGSGVQTNNVTFGKFTRLYVQLGVAPGSNDCLAVNGKIDLGSASNTNYLDIGILSGTPKSGDYTIAAFNVLTGRFTAVRSAPGTTLPRGYKVSYLGTATGNGNELANGSIVFTMPGGGTAIFVR